MWYLPMLFWCFVGMVILQKIKIGDKWKLLFLVLVNVLCNISLPLRLDATTNYIFYFYLGYVIYKQSDYIKENLTHKHVIISWLIFIVAFILFRPLKELMIGNQDYILHKVLTSIMRSMCQLIYATIGTITFYISMVSYTKSKQLNKLTYNLALCSFGIYLIHQFILKILYYYTDFSSLVGSYWLPWLGFLLVFPTSYLISFFLLKTKIGKLLIG